jgi:hypothetical protein
MKSNTQTFKLDTFKLHVASPGLERLGRFSSRAVLTRPEHHRIQQYSTIFHMTDDWFTPRKDMVGH